MLLILLKKQWTETMSSFNRNKVRSAIPGMLLTVVLIGFIVTVGVLILSKFVGLYCDIRFDGIKNIPARQHELLTILYSVVLIIGVFSGMRELSSALFESQDKEILSTLPINQHAIFYSKLITIYIKQLAVYAVTLLPINLTFAMVTEQSVYYYLLTCVICLIFPVIALAISSIFCLPAYLVKRFLKVKYVLTLLLMTSIAGVLFWGYSEILQFINSIITTGEIKFFFKEEVMTGIINVTKHLYPSNVIANILLKNELGRNFGILFGIAVAAAVIGFAMVSILYYKAQFSPITKERKGKPASMKSRSLLATLLNNETTSIFRTPAYAFQYYSVTAIMPLMVYFCMSIVSDLLETVAFADSNFELAVLIILLFGTLTNTFCTVAVSRDGKAFYTMKNLPISPAVILSSKIIFSSIASIVSNIICCILVATLSYVTWPEAVFIFFTEFCILEAQILFGIRKDLNRPSFADDGCEMAENGNTSVFICLWLIVDLVIGGLALFISLYFVTLKNKGNANMYVHLYLAFCAIICLALSAVYFFVGLKKRYAGMTEGNTYEA